MHGLVFNFKINQNWLKQKESNVKGILFLSKYSLVV